MIFTDMSLEFSVEEKQRRKIQNTLFISLLLFIR